MPENVIPQSQNTSQIEQAAELWVNIVLEQIKHKRFALEKLVDTNKYNKDKNEKLYPNT